MAVLTVHRLGDATPIRLQQRHFVAEGGEAKVFARGGTAFKIHHDPSRVPAKSKLDRLAAMADPRILAPQDLLVDAAGQPVGFTTAFLADAWPLARLVPPAFKRREGVTEAMIQHLILCLRSAVQAAHDGGALIVDLNAFNVLVRPDFADLCCIDVDSWQLPGHPATALMDAVRDWTRPDFTRETDWFSFAVVTFELFTGLHPFKGRYLGPEDALRGRLPTDAADDPFALTRRRMQAGVSVLSPEVQVPPAAAPFSVIPAGWRAWYQRLLEDGQRGAPPTDFTHSGPVVFVAPTPIPQTAAGLQATVVDRVEGAIRRLFVDPLHRVVVTSRGVWLDGRRVNISPDAVKACAFSPRARRPVAVDDRGATLALVDLSTGTPVPFGLAADTVASIDGQVWFKTGDQVHALELTEAGDRLFASARPVANVLPHAARLFPGVVIQNLLGATFVSLLEDQTARQIRVPDLDGLSVLDARHHRGVLIVAGHRQGQCERVLLRFDGDTVDARIAQDVPPVVPGFVVLPSGVCLCPTDDGRLELFPAKPGGAKHRHVDDPRLTDAPLLAEQAGAVLLARAGEVLAVRMR